MFRVRVDDAKLLKDTVTAISTIIDDATFNADPEKIDLRAMDPSRVAMIDFEWPKTIFDEYICNEATKICVNIGEMLKLLKRAGRDESVELSLDEKRGRLQVTIKGNYMRVFNMPTLEAMDEIIPLPKVSFNVKAEITTEGLRKAIEDASMVSDHVRIELDDEKMVLRATGDILGAVIELRKGDDSLLNLEAKAVSKATFSLSYLSDIVKAAEATSEVVKVEFSNDMPIRLDFKQQQKGKLIYYLAPRIEVE